VSIEAKLRGEPAATPGRATLDLIEQLRGLLDFSGPVKSAGSAESNLQLADIHFRSPVVAALSMCDSCAGFKDNAIPFVGSFRPFVGRTRPFVGAGDAAK